MGYFDQLEFKEKLNDLYDEYKLLIQREEIAEILIEVADSIDKRKPPDDQKKGVSNVWGNLKEKDWTFHPSILREVGQKALLIHMPQTLTS